MKLLITTRADQTVQGWANLVHPIFKKYADRVGADFATLDETLNRNEAATGIGDGLWHFNSPRRCGLTQAAAPTVYGSSSETVW